MASAFCKATHEQTRVHNRCLVLKIIHDQERISRAAIARMTHLTRATVSTAVGDLIEDGLVREVGLTSSTGGKPVTLLSFVDDARDVIGLELANHEFRGAVIDLRGEALLDPMRQEVERCVHYELAKDVRISPSYLGQDIVVQGAVALVLSKELGLA